MNKKQEQLLSLLSEIHDIVIRVYDVTNKPKCVKRFGTTSQEFDEGEELVRRDDPDRINPNYKFGLTDIGKILLAGYFFSNDGKQFYVIGPIRLSPPTKEYIDKILEKNNLPILYREKIFNYLQSIPSIPVTKFANIISAISLILNEKPIDINKLVKTASKEVYEESTKIDRIFNNEYVRSPQHSDGQYEQRLIYIIRNGLVEELDKVKYDQDNTKMGKLASDDLRSLKNGLIILNSICLRAALSGGLDAETCYALGEFYAQKIENSYSMGELNSLSKTLRRDYCNRVRDISIPQINNLHVFNATKYIEDNIYTKITVAEVADEIHIQPEYLSYLFKKELKTTVSKYIINRKIVEAKKFLRFTDMSLSEISSTLCFASQSHFQNHFKKIRGISPNKYRELYRSSNYDRL